MAGIILDLRAIRKAMDETNAPIVLKTELDRAISDLGRVATQTQDVDSMLLYSNLDAARPVIRKLVQMLGRIA